MQEVCSGLMCMLISSIILLLVSYRSVIYKEQVRLNQVAANALMARLEAQKAISDAAEKELHKKFKQREDIEKQIRPEWDQTRKRSRMDDTLFEERDSRTIIYLPGAKPRTPSHKELRVFLEEEQKTTEAETNATQKVEEDMPNTPATSFAREQIEEDHDKSIIPVEDLYLVEDHLKRLEIREGKRNMYNVEMEEDEESRKQRGKGNVERWLHMLLENGHEDEIIGHEDANGNGTLTTEDIITKLDQVYPQKDRESPAQVPEEKQQNEEINKIETEETHREKGKITETSRVMEEHAAESRKSLDIKQKAQKNVKEKTLTRSASARGFRRIPSSPSLILKKGVDCMRKKPIVVTGDDDGDDENYVTGNSFFKSSIKALKKTVKL